MTATRPTSQPLPARIRRSGAPAAAFLFAAGLFAAALFGASPFGGAARAEAPAERWRIPVAEPLRAPRSEARQRLAATFRAAIDVGVGPRRVLAWSPDGAWLAVGDAAGLSFWSARDGKRGLHLPGKIRAVAFHPTLAQAAVLDATGVALHAAPDGRLLRRFAVAPEARIGPAPARRGPSAWEEAAVLRFSSDGGRLTAADRTWLASWNLSSGEGGAALVGEGAWGVACTAAVSPDGLHVAAPLPGGRAALWDAVALKPLRTLSAHRGEVEALAFTADGRGLVTASSEDGAVRTWSVAESSRIGEAEWNGPIVRGLLPGPRGAWAAQSFKGLTLVEPGGRPATPFLQLDAPLEAAAFSPGMRTVAVLESNRPQLVLYDLEVSREHRTMPGGWLGYGKLEGRHSARRILPLADEEHVVLEYSGGPVKLVEIARGKPLRRFGRGGDAQLAPPAALAEDGRSLHLAVLETIPNTARPFPPYRIERRSLLVNRGPAADASTSLDEILTSPTALAASPAGDRLAASGEADLKGGFLAMLDPQVGSLLWKTRGHRSVVGCMAFSADGKRLACGGDDACVTVWDVASERRLHRLRAHEGAVQSVDFSPDGRLLATTGGGLDDVVALWDVESGASRGFLSGHVGPVAGAVFSPDGRRLVSTGKDRRLRVWDVATGKPQGDFAGLDDPAVHVARSYDGGSVVALAKDGTAKWWRFSDLETPRESEAAWLRTPSPRPIDLAPVFSGLLTELKSRSVYTSALSPDGSLLAMADSIDGFALWDFAPVRDAARRNRPQGDAFRPDGTPPLAFGAWLRRPRLPAGEPDALAFSPDCKTLYGAVSYGPDGPVDLRAWNAASGEMQFEAAGLVARDGRRTRLVCSPDGRRLALSLISCTEGRLQVHDARNGALLYALDHPVVDARFTPDGATLVAASSDRLRLLDAATGAVKAVWTPPREDSSEWICGVGITADGETLAAASMQGGRTTRFFFYDLPSGRLVKTVGDPESFTARFRDSEPGDVEERLPESRVGFHRSRLREQFAYCVLTPDGKYVGGSSRGERGAEIPRFFEVASGRAVCTLPGVESALALSAKGDVLLTCGGGRWNELKAWSVEDLFDEKLREVLAPILAAVPRPSPDETPPEGVHSALQHGFLIRRDGDALMVEAPIHGRKSQEAAARLAATGLPMRLDFYHSTAFAASTLAALAGRENIRGLWFAPRWEWEDPDRPNASLESVEEISEQGLRSIGSLQGLEEVEAPGGAGLGVLLEQLRGCPRLRTLSIPAEYGDVDDAALEPLAELKSLERLELAFGDGVTDDGLAVVGELPRLRSLTLCTGEEISAEGLLCLDGLERLERLSITPRGEIGPSLRSLAGLPRLEELELCGEAVDDATLKHVGKASGLKRLKLWGTSVEGPGLVHLKNLTTLESFVVGAEDGHKGEWFHGKGLEHLRNNPKLVELRLVQTRIDEEGARSLGELVQLEALTLPKDTTDQELAALDKLVNLQALMLYFSNVTGPGLAAVAHMPHLVSLDLHGATVEDAGLVHLVGLKTLRWLDLSFSRVTDAGLAHLAGLTELRRLDLHSAPITDAGLVHLEKLERLESLDLRGTKITVAGVKRLAQRKALRILGFRGKIDAEEAEAIRRINPRLLIRE